MEQETTNQSLFESIEEIDTKLSEERNVEFENSKLDPNIIRKNPLYDQMKEFWEFWILNHKEEYQNIVRGKPQFENILKDESI